MGFYLSPGVFTKELDLSEVVTSVSTSVGALVGWARQGAINSRKLITNTKQFIDEFGKPEAGNYFHYSALAYLAKGNKLYCTRVVNGALYGGVIIMADIEPTSNSGLGTGFVSPDFEVVSAQQRLFYIFGKNPGIWDNRLSVTVGAIDSNDEFEINVYLDDVKVETWVVSRTVGHKDGYGNNNYLEDAINGYSDYIVVADGDLDADLAIKVQTTLLDFTGGIDGTAPTVAQINAGWDLYSNPDDVDVSILINGGETSVTVQNYMINIAGTLRKDCIAILDMPYLNNAVEDMVTYRTSTLNANTSYAALYAPWLKIFDTYNNASIEVPASGYIAGVIAYTDFISDPWFAPAGFSRALLDVLGVTVTFDQSERDILHEASINPIQKFSGEGIVVWGQKTLLSRASAFDRINVRRLLNVIEKSVSRALKLFTFEPNDELTRLRIIQMLDEFLRDVMSRRGLYDYKIVCDTTNNTSTTIDRNELHVDVYLKPVKASEFITLQVVVTTTGASFEEVASSLA